MKIREQISGRATSRAVKCALALLVLFSGACAGNPEPEPLPAYLIGQRARVVTDPAGLTDPPVGVLSLLTADSVVLKTGNGVWQPIHLGPGRRLEISRGITSKAGRGAGIGALAGGVGLAFVGAVSCAGDNEDGFFYISPAACALGGGLIGAGAGALVGLVIGSVSKTEHWVEVPARARR